MPRLYLHVIVIPLLIFTSLLLLIHAQPYDDHELRELLLPEGCPAPCFMGIRPGVTTMDEAVRLLEASGKVDHSSINIIISSSYPNSADTNRPSSIQWNWKINTNQHLISDSNHFDGIIYVQNNLIEKIVTQIHFRLGEIYSSFGFASEIGFASIRTISVPWGIEVFHLYPQYGFVFQSDINTCPYFNALWLPEVRVEMGQILTAPVSGYMPSAELKQRVIQRLHIFCKI